MGLVGPAWVRAIAASPIIRPGAGRVVTGTFTHLNSFVYELRFEGESLPLRGTRQHPVYSVDREAFVRIDELRVGEVLRTSSGTARISNLSRVPGDHQVYNIEIEDEHVYYVGDLEVLVHNSCADSIAVGLLGTWNHARGLVGRFADKVGAKTYWDFYSGPLPSNQGIVARMVGQFSKRSSIHVNLSGLAQVEAQGLADIGILPGPSYP